MANLNESFNGVKKISPENIKHQAEEKKRKEMEMQKKGVYQKETKRNGSK